MYSHWCEIHLALNTPDMCGIMHCAVSHAYIMPCRHGMLLVTRGTAAEWGLTIHQRCELQVSACVCAGIPGASGHHCGATVVQHRASNGECCPAQAPAVVIECQRELIMVYVTGCAGTGCAPLLE